MKAVILFMMVAAIAPLIAVVATTLVSVPNASAQDENMTMEELTNASLAQYPDTMENETNMEEETAALVGNITGNMTSQNMTNGNVTA
jgi:uncharacterized BrkB/YihY/UPF0761 family membrane protein